MSHKISSKTTFEDLLIKAVFEMRAIWDPTDRLRGNSRAVRNMWIQIANELGCDVKFVKAKWKNMRQYYVSETRKMNILAKSRPGEKVSSTWNYFNKLVFLRDTLNQDLLDHDLMQNDTIEGETDEEPEIDLSKLTNGPLEVDVGGAIEMNIDQTPVEIQYDFSPSKPFSPTNNTSQLRRALLNKRKFGRAGLAENHSAAKRSAQFLAIEKRKVGLLERELINEQNPDLQFFKSLIPFMADFTPVQKLRVRSKIQDIILSEQEKLYSGTELSTCHGSDKFILS